jgi:hypothetical protein
VRVRRPRPAARQRTLFTSTHARGSCASSRA